MGSALLEGFSSCRGLFSDPAVVSYDGVDVEISRADKHPFVLELLAFEFIEHGSIANIGWSS